jgi:hypothetical protein
MSRDFNRLDRFQRTPVLNRSKEEGRRNCGCAAGVVSPRKPFKSRRLPPKNFSLSPHSPTALSSARPRSQRGAFRRRSVRGARRRRLCGRGATYVMHSEGPGTPPYGHSGRARGARCDDAREVLLRTQARSGVGGVSQGAARWNAAMERRKARRLSQETPNENDVAPAGAPSPSHPARGDLTIPRAEFRRENAGGCLKSSPSSSPGRVGPRERSASGEPTRDPVIYGELQQVRRCHMDCRVEPGNDE